MVLSLSLIKIILFFSQRRGHKDEFGFLRRVVYQKEYPSFDPLQSENRENYFLIKSIDWEYEHEWRMLLPQSNSHKTINTNGIEFDLYKIPSNLIKTIILVAIPPRISEKKHLAFYIHEKIIVMSLSCRLQSRNQNSRLN